MDHIGFTLHSEVILKVWRRPRCSVVSKRNFARKYAFDSIFEALQDLHPLHSCDLKIFAKKIGNGFFFSIYALMEQYCYRRFSHTNTRRQTSPPATATVSVDSQREAEIYRNTTTLQDAPGRFLCAMCAKLGEILKSCRS